MLAVSESKAGAAPAISAPERVLKVLVIRMSAIGDVILTLPVVDAIRAKWPAARIDFAVKREFAELVAGHPGVARVWQFERASGLGGLFGLGRAMAAEGYDLVVDLHRNPRSIYLRWRSRAWMRRVYRKWTWQRILLKVTGINLLKNAPPVVDRYFTALEDFGVRRAGRPKLHLSPTVTAAATVILAREGISPAGFIAVAPGASYPTKQWPAAGFVAAAAELAGPGGQVAVLGGGSDREAAAAVATGLAERGVRAADLAGSLSLAESAAVIARARLLLTNDSGLMHVGDALDVPLVAVFGPTSRELGFYPLGPRSCVVEHNGVRCRPCTLHGDPSCKKKHHRCMEEICAEDVVLAARSRLVSLAQSDADSNAI